MNAELLKELVEYRTSKQKSVMMASRSILQLYRIINPELLPRKERVWLLSLSQLISHLTHLTFVICCQGRPTEAMSELTIKAYGAVDAKDYIPGAEALRADGEDVVSETENDKTVEDNESDDGWIDVSHSEDEGAESDSEDGSDQDDDDEDEEEEDDDEEEEGDVEEGSEVSGDEDSDEDDDEDDEDDEDEEDSDDDEDDDTAERSKRPLSKREKKKIKRIKKDMKRMQKKKEVSSEDPTLVEERKAKAAAVSLSRILTDKDFSKIDAAQVKKQLDASKARQKRKVADDLDDSIKR